MYGAFVRHVREAAGLTQCDLAAVSGMQQSNISAIESGRRRPSADTLNRLLVASGFELAAVGREHILYCPLPKAGWFPDEDLPAPHPDDPVDERPSVGADRPVEERAAIIAAVLDGADATRR